MTTEPTTEDLQGVPEEFQGTSAAGFFAEAWTQAAEVLDLDPETDDLPATVGEAIYAAASVVAHMESLSEGIREHGAVTATGGVSDLLKEHRAQATILSRLLNQIPSKVSAGRGGRSRNGVKGAQSRGYFGDGARQRR
jgi:hypothetical protein